MLPSRRALPEGAPLPRSTVAGNIDKDSASSKFGREGVGKDPAGMDAYIERSPLAG